MWLDNSMRIKSFLLRVFDSYQPALIPQRSWATWEVHCSGIWDGHGSSCSLDFAQVLPCTGDRFGILWEGWSTNSAAASGIPGLSRCVNREGRVCTSEYICGVGGYRLSCGRAAERMFYCCCHNYIWKTRKKTTHCSGQAKRTSAEFYFPIAKACLDCFCSKKESQVLCVWWMADGPEMRLLSLRLICCHHEVCGYLE